METSNGVFSGYGDASAANVGRMIAPHIIRMAETRAVARALRLACNIGMTSREELGGSDDHAEPAKVVEPEKKKTLPIADGKQRGEMLRLSKSGYLPDKVKARLTTLLEDTTLEAKIAAEAIDFSSKQEKAKREEAKSNEKAGDA